LLPLIKKISYNMCKLYRKIAEMLINNIIYIIQTLLLEICRNITPIQCNNMQDSIDIDPASSIIYNLTHNKWEIDYKG
ncbi:MAG: hypothetical protein PHP68_06645, partial [Oscillospiraceae bacterium]|nr:hypothetical protein [Oscillospiraceae bacterium]